MKIRVNPHTVEIIKEQTEPINEKEIKVSKCEFEFDEAITNDFVKEAYFTLNGNTYKMIVENNECDYPSEVLVEKGTLEIGVVAFKVENGEEIVRYNPSPDYFESWVGSLKDAENSEPITPSEMEQFEQELQEGLNEIDDKIDEVDGKITEVNTAITETNNLNLDVSDKVDGDVTVTLTKKDASTKSVVISDGTSLQFMWQGTSLGIKTDDMSEYVFVDLQGVQGVPGPKGDAFQIKKTYPTVEAMNADFNNMELGDYVMIASEVSIEDNAKLYTRGQNAWIFISDFSGSQGIKGETGATPNIQIGTVTSGSTPSVTRTGTNENPVLNFVLQPGPQGDTGPTGPTGNGIDHISLTSQSGATKVYTIYFTDGNTTTFTVEDGEVTQEVFDEEIERANMIYNAMPKVSDEGTDLTLDNTAECPVYDIELSPSELEQETTSISEGDEYDSPSPEHPQEIHTVSGDNTVVVGNKNLFNIEWLVSTGITVENGVATGKATAFTNNFGIGNNLYIPNTNNFGNKQISLSVSAYSDGSMASNNGLTVDINYVDGTRTRIVFSNNTTTKTTKTATSTSGKEIKSLNFSYINGPNVIWYVSDFIITYTDTPQEYVPYTIQSLPLSLGDLEYCKIGDYEDEFRKSTGKNLFDKDNTTIQNALLSDDGYYSSNNTNKSFIFECEGNTTYTISKVASTRFRVAEFESLPTIGSLYSNRIKNDTDISITYTTSNNAKYLVVSFYNTSDTLSEQTILNTVQIEQGSSATEYEPYGKQWYLKKNIGKVVLDGTEEDWFNDGGGAPFAIHAPVKTIDSQCMVMSDYFIGLKYNASWGVYDAMVSTSKQTVTNPALKFRYADIGGLANFKTWLSEHNTIVYYVLATPTYTLLNDTLQTQLDNIQKAITYQEQTNVYQTNNDLPFVIKLSAIRDLSGIFEEI